RSDHVAPAADVGGLVVYCFVLANFDAARALIAELFVSDRKSGVRAALIEPHMVAAWTSFWNRRVHRGSRASRALLCTLCPLDARPDAVAQGHRSLVSS